MCLYDYTSVADPVPGFATGLRLNTGIVFETVGTGTFFIIDNFLCLTYEMPGEGGG